MKIEAFLKNEILVFTILIASCAKESYKLGCYKMVDILHWDLNLN